MSETKRSIFYYFLCILLIFLGINGTCGGLLLFLKPDGSLLGMQQGWLEHSPFNNYFIPGILLFSFMGLLPLLTFAGLVKRFSWKWLNVLNIYSDKYWAWTFCIYSGIIAIMWITIQLIMTQYFWIQPLIIFTGLGIIICALVPGVMNHYTKSNLP